MLATLNLQFSPIELTDDTFVPPTVAPSGGETAGFADLLRLRVDTGQGTELPGGAFLPPGGSELPLQALELDTELPELSGELLPVAELPLMAGSLSEDGSDIALDVTLRYPATPKLAGQPVQETIDTAQSVAAAATGLPTTEQPQAVAAVPGTQSLGSLAAETLSLATPQPVAAGVRLQQAIAAPGERADVPLPATAPREQNLKMAQQQSLVASPGRADEHVAAVDMPRRPETPVLAGSAVLSEEISEVFKARPTVTPTVQVLGSQPNPQQAPPLTTVSPNVIAAPETSYAAATQQLTDLVSTPVRDSAWGEQIGERVLLMAGNQMKTADIRLTPAELGPLRVQVSVEDGAAHVSFQAQHAVTREAIEQALPRLRELLAENGLSLGQASVGEQGVAERNREEHPESELARPGADEGAESGGGEERSERPSVVSSRGLVDTFA